MRGARSVIEVGSRACEGARRCRLVRASDRLDGGGTRWHSCRSDEESSAQRHEPGTPRERWTTLPWTGQSFRHSRSRSAEVAEADRSPRDRNTPRAVVPCARHQAAALPSWHRRFALVARLVGGVRLPDRAPGPLRRLAAEMGKTVIFAVPETEALYSESGPGPFRARARADPELLGPALHGDRQVAAGAARPRGGQAPGRCRPVSAHDPSHCT